MKITQASFRITGWLCKIPKLIKMNGSTGEFNAMTIDLSIEKPVRNQQPETNGTRPKMEFYCYHIEVAGKIAEAINKNIEAGEWHPGDRVEIEGDIITRFYNKDQNNGRGYERPVLKAARIFNGTAYDMKKLKNKDKYSEANLPVQTADNDGMPNVSVDASDLSFENFPFGSNAKLAEVTL